MGKKGDGETVRRGNGRKRALIYFTHFAASIGGSEYLPLLVIASLQRRGVDVTLALNWRSEIECASRLAGVPIDMDALKVVLVKPKSALLRKIDASYPFCRTRRLKRLAKDADICISCANMVDFGKSAHHFVFLLRHFGDNAFNDYFMKAPPLTGLALAKRRLRTFVAERFLRPLLGFRSSRSLLADPREHIYPNSLYVEKTMRDFYGPFTSEVFYPPTVFEFGAAATERDALAVVCLSRIIPEKRVLEIVEAVEMARAKSGLALRLRIGGQLEPPTAYTAAVRKCAEERDWVELAGALYGADKEKFLLSASFAMHAERDEAFGISVVEYLKAGLVPVVPDGGGAREIVDNPDLTFSTTEDAANIIARLATDAAFAARQRERCRERALRFSRDEYMRRQEELLDRILGAGGAAANA